MRGVWQVVGAWDGLLGARETSCWTVFPARPHCCCCCTHPSVQGIAKLKAVAALKFAAPGG